MGKYGVKIRETFQVKTAIDYQRMKPFSESLSDYLPIYLKPSEVSRHTSLFC